MRFSIEVRDVIDYAVVLVVEDQERIETVRVYEPNPATAAEHAAHLISEALHATGLADRFPTVYEVEPVTERIPA